MDLSILRHHGCCKCHGLIAQQKIFLGWGYTESEESEEEHLIICINIIFSVAVQHNCMSVVSGTWLVCKRWDEGLDCLVAMASFLSLPSFWQFRFAVRSQF